MWIGKQKQEGVKPINGILSFSFLICGSVKRNMRDLTPHVSLYLSTYQEGEG
jgi:hypothetical protein